MSRPIFTLEARLEPIPTIEMPPNSELLARVYVGDFAFGLLRERRNRALYFASTDGYFLLDVPHLLASFADALRHWQREMGWLSGEGLTGRLPDAAIAARRARPGDRRIASAADRARAPAIALRRVAVQSRRAADRRRARPGRARRKAS